MTRTLRPIGLSAGLSAGLLAALSLALPGTAAPAKSPKPPDAKHFHAAAQAALAAMRTEADTLHIQGVAVVAFAPGGTIGGWVSEMAVVGHMTDNKSDKGNNLLGIAYAKAAEMANTLQNSGTSGKTPMTGEFGWQGGAIARVPQGYLIVSFSGGRSEDDLTTSKAGLATLQSHL